MSRLAVIGIGEDGWDGLGRRARDLLTAATRVIGAPRQLALLPGERVAATLEPWPTPMLARVQSLAQAVADADPQVAGTVVLGSGDPMLHGVGATLARLVSPDRLEILPAPSAYSLACARLGWAQHEVPLVSLVADPRADVLAALHTGRAVVYVPGAGGAAGLAEQLRDVGLGHARLAIFERLGGPAERRIDARANECTAECDPLHLVAVDLAGDAPAPVGRLASPVPGLPDDVYVSDGQLTRADVRAVALAALAPRAGEVLWDLGAGTGTIAIEWCRAVPGARAYAVERRADRCANVAENAARLGVGGRVTVVPGELPDTLAALAAPDAIFLGGATSQPRLIDRCWAALRPGGRLVAAAVTLESEQALIAAHARLGGRLVRLEHSHVDALGAFTAWRPHRPIVQWTATKSHLGSTA